MLRRSSSQLVMLAVLGAVAVFSVTAGSAATTTKPYTASFDAGPIAGGSSVWVDLVLTNRASPQTLGSANITAATLGTSSFTITNATPSQYLDSTQTFPTSVLKLRNLNVAPNGGTRQISIQVSTPCVAGDYTWGVQAKQNNDFSGPPGNDFWLDPNGTNRVTSVAGPCRLEWVTEPASANPNAAITGTPYSPNASNVAVEAVDGVGNRLTSLDSGAVTLTPTAGTTTSAGEFSGIQATFDDGVATFADLKSSATGYGFKLRADSPGFTSTPDSGEFDIFLGTLCTTTGCQTPALTPDGTYGQAQTSSGNFVFLGIGTLDGTTCIVPNFESVQGPGAAPIVVTEQRVGPVLGGELFVTYGIKKSIIEKRYGKTSGEQFIPICAGSKRIKLNASGTSEAVPCNAKYPDQNGDDQTPWMGMALDSEGKFSGGLAVAICDLSSGYYVGILGSHQDYTKGIDPNTNPTVTGWKSDNTYRYFTIRYPASSGPSGTAFDGVPWDGWQGG